MQLAGQDGDKRVGARHAIFPVRSRSFARAGLIGGVNHIDTSDFYGPHVTNQIIKQALHPYSDDLVIVTKVGDAAAARRFLLTHALARRL